MHASRSLPYDAPGLVFVSRSDASRAYDRHVNGRYRRAPRRRPKRHVGTVKTNATATHVGM